MVSTFFRRVAKHFANEMAVVTPNGELLAHDLQTGLKKWRELPAEKRKSLDDLGAYNTQLDPEPPPAGLVLQVYSRAFEPDRAGQLKIYKTEVARSLEPGRDHLWLTKEEWQSLAPSADAKVGDELSVPAHLVQRIARRYLIDLVRVGGNGGPRRAEEVLAAAAKLSIDKVTPEAIHLKLTGAAKVATQDGGSGAKNNLPKIDEYALSGTLVYDRGTERFTSIDLVCFSPTGHFDEIHNRTLPLAVTFELLSGKIAAERLPPSSFGEDYFAR
jgi:hypothetical protein